MSLILWIATLLLAAPVASQPPTPESQIGFQVGEDFKIASWSQIVNYFSLLADHSDRIEVETLGQSTNGRPFIVATISDPANLGRKEAIKADQRKLADPRLLAEGEAEAIAAGYRCACRYLRLADVPRAIANHNTRGGIKIVADADTGKVLGVHALADTAGEMMLAATYAIKAGFTVTQLADTWAPYLTMAEGIRLTANLFRNELPTSCCA